ncbi:MAG: tRNA uridine-5-carboxymethylaminomethyl(34) synthesis enzyme MnmG [Trichlorobacter sp.]
MHSYETIYGVIVVGAGHAGCEAALAAARMGCRTLLLNMSLDGIAVMSCNPSIGGLAKGHLVREIDALGGEMGKNIDATGIQFRVLNTRKGPAVRAGRAQADKQLYRLRMKQVLEHQSYLDIKQAEVTALYFEQGVLKGVETRSGIRFLGETVVLTTGTFMRGLIHIGLINYSGGRAGDLPSLGLSDQLRDIGFGVGRLKTGTPARLDGRTIDFSKLEAQYSDDPPVPFSFSTEQITMQQIPCYIAYTNPRTHEIIRGGLDRSPLYAGVIEGIGPRYCPSIEDKVVRFPEKERHQTFIEPEGLDTVEYYPSGMSTSLPIDVQIAFYRSMVGLEQVEIMRPAYGIEYDYVDPVELHATLETKRTPNLFHAGQINGTSGYEEAAGQGILAGINAALRVKGEDLITLGRHEAYIGVMVDDLVTLGTKEPYRMFTSRAEYRLLLREDNADMRLRDLGYRLGLVDQQTYDYFCDKRNQITQEIARLSTTRMDLTPEQRGCCEALGCSDIQKGTSLEHFLRRPEVTYDDIASFDPVAESIRADVRDQVAINIKYKGYIDRQEEQIERLRRYEEVSIPADFSYDSLPGLTTEVREKLDKYRPDTLGQALRIQGVTPAAISVITISLKGRGLL